MFSLFYICRGLKLPALKKAVSTTSSRMRTSKRKAACGEDRKDMQQLEDVKPLIVPREGQVYGTPQKLVVNVETLTFRPVDGSRLQTARRGRPFTPGNLHGGGRAKGIDRGVLQNEAAFKDKISVEFLLILMTLKKI